MKTFVRKNDWLSFSSHGWGNGYVIIPKEHKLNGVGYDEIEVDVHGGLTFAESVNDFIQEGDWKKFLDEEDKGGWIVGFDTAHYPDTLDNWSETEVKNETENLKEQLENYK